METIVVKYCGVPEGGFKCENPDMIKGTDLCYCGFLHQTKRLELDQLPLQMEWWDSFNIELFKSFKRERAKLDKMY